MHATNSLKASLSARAGGGGGGGGGGGASKLSHHAYAKCLMVLSCSTDLCEAEEI